MRRPLKEGVAAACVWRARRRARLWLLQELQLQEVAAAEPQLQETTAAAAAARLRRPRAVPARRPGRRPLEGCVAAAWVWRSRRRARLWLLHELQLQDVAAADQQLQEVAAELQLQEVAAADQQQLQDAAAGSAGCRGHVPEPSERHRPPLAVALVAVAVAVAVVSILHSSGCEGLQELQLQEVAAELQLQEVAAAAACVWRARRRARLWLLQELQLQEVAVAVAVAVVSTLAVFPAEGEPSAGTTPKVTRTLHALSISHVPDEACLLQAIPTIAPRGGLPRRVSTCK